MGQWFNADPKYKVLAQDIIDSAPSELGHIDLGKVMFLEYQTEKPKEPVKIAKVPDPFKTLYGYDFYVTVNEELISGLTIEHLELEMFRVLLHIDVEPGKMKFPDVYEFSNILTNFGADWRLQPTVGSVLQQLKSGKNLF